MAQNESTIEQLETYTKNTALSNDSLATIYHQLTIKYVQQQEYDQALRATQREIRLLPEATEKRGNAHYNLAGIYRSLSQYNLALAAAKKALTNYEKALGTAHSECASAQLFIAQTYYLLRQLDETKTWTEKALTTYQKNANIPPKVVLKIQLLQSSVAAEQLDMPAAEATLLAAEAFYQQHTQKLSQEWLARIYNNLASIADKQYRPIQSLAYHQKVVGIRQAIHHPNHVSLANTYSNISICYNQLNDIPQAILFEQKSLDILQRVAPLPLAPIAAAEYQLGYLHYCNDNLLEAERWLDQSLKNYAVASNRYALEIANNWWLLARMEQKKGNFDKANYWLQKSILAKQKLPTSTPIDFIKLYLDQCLFLEQQGNYLAAWQASQLAWKISTDSSLSIPSILWFRVLSAQLKVSSYLDIDAQAVAFDKLSLLPAVLDRAMRDLVIESDQHLLTEGIRIVCNYGLKVCLQLEQKKHDPIYLQEALRLMEYNKAVALQFTLQKRQQIQQLSPALQQQYYQLKADLQLLEAQFLQYTSSATNTDFSQAVSPLLIQKKQALQQFYQQHFSNQKIVGYTCIELSKLQQKLVKDSSQIISYFYGNTDLYRLVLEHNSCQLTAIKLNFEQPLEQFVAQLTQLETSKEDLEKACQQYQKIAYQIRQQLLPERLLPRVHIIPDGKLHYLPFEATTNSLKNNPTGFHQLDYLVKKTAISYAYSATTFFAQQYEHTNKKQAAVAAFAPDYRPDGKLPNLPHATQELHYLQTHFAGDFYTKRQATKRCFEQLQAPYGLVHLALHGQASINDYSKPASLYFSDWDSDTSILVASQIIACPLQTDMLTLSACQTGIGEWKAGEGVLSLARNFMAVGVPTVLTTLWQVNDQSSSELLQNFYQHIDTQDKATALRLAKCQYLDEASAFRSHPYFWSGYILLGNTASLDLKPSGFNFLWYLVPSISLVVFLSSLFIYYQKKKS